MIDKNYIHPKRFKWNINNNISPSMLSFWQQNGFLIIDSFYSVDECENLKNRAKLLIKNYSPDNEVPNSLNNYDMKNESFKFSASNIAFFHEDDDCKELKSISKNEVENIKEIGHAIHDLDPVFNNFSRKRSLAILATSLGIEMPLLAKSTYILKHSYNDKYSSYNQDSSMLYTEPESCIGCTISLDNETIENGCLWTFSQGHLEPLKKKWESFGWKVLEVDGHDHKKLFKIFNHQSFNKPLCIICHTIKGKGVKFMEKNNLWHYRTARGKEFLEAQIQIEKKI